jgi:hypothetical protein
VRGKFGRHGQTHPSRYSSRAFARTKANTLSGTLDVLGRRQNLLPERRGQVPGGGPVEQRCANRGFQRRQSPAHRGVFDTEFAGGH